MRVSPQQSYNQDKDAQKGRARGNAGNELNDCVGIVGVIPRHEPARKQRTDRRLLRHPPVIFSGVTQGLRAHCHAGSKR